jgi:hypothetical protein
MREEEEVAQVYTIPAPVTGWNARDSLDLPPEQGGMAETDAIRLVNWFPDGANITLRRGYASHSTGMGGAVQSLFEYTGASGTSVLVAAANGELWDASVSGDPATSLSNGFTSNKWQGTIFRHTLILVNGTDQPQQYTGGASTSSATYTGTGLTDNNLVNVSAYKSRLYFVQLNSANVWYSTNVDEITGVLIKLDLSSNLQRGGHILYAGSWSRDTGRGLEDLFVVISSEGEVVVFEGDFPGDSNWTNVSRFNIGAPLGYRASVGMGPDLVVMVEDGFYPLSDLLSGNSVGTYSKLSDKIRNAISAATRNYFSNFGWSAVHYKRGRYALFNIPVASDTAYEQYVVNTVSGAWCKFTGMNGICWTTYNNELYFGGAGGIVYKADSGADDNGSFISTDIKQAFNYFGDRSLKKRYLLARPIFFGDRSTEFLFDIDTDFEDKPIASTVNVMGNSGTLWDEGIWDVSPWDSSGSYGQAWYKINGLGRCVALRIKADFMGAELSLTSVNVSYETGGVL